MKSNIIETPDEATMIRYWGSAEAYLEEQRRTATYALEVNQLEAGSDFSNNSLLSSNVINAAHKAHKSGLHLPFSLRNFRHA